MIAFPLGMRRMLFHVSSVACTLRYVYWSNVLYIDMTVQFTCSTDGYSSCRGSIFIVVSRFSQIIIISYSWVCPFIYCS